MTTYVQELMDKLKAGKVLPRERPIVNPRRYQAELNRAEKRRKASKRKRAKAATPLEARLRKYEQNNARAATIAGMHNHLLRACKARQKQFLKKADAREAAGDTAGADRARLCAENWSFQISLEAWCLLWLNCRAIIRVETQTIPGSSDTVAISKETPAWQARGNNPYTDVQLQRIDKSKPWTIDNVQVWYRGEVISK